MLESPLLTLGGVHYCMYIFHWHTPVRCQRDIGLSDSFRRVAQTHPVHSFSRPPPGGFLRYKRISACSGRTPCKVLHTETRRPGRSMPLEYKELLLLLLLRNTVLWPHVHIVSGRPWLTDIWRLTVYLNVALRHSQEVPDYIHVHGRDPYQIQEKQD